MNEKCFHQRISGEVDIYDHVAGTLTANSGGGEVSTCFAFKFHQGSAAKGIGWEEEVSPTLIADYHNPAVVMTFE